MARPTLSYLKNLILAVVGLLIGLWSGWTGLGLSAVAGPFLVWLIGLANRRLSATVLLMTAAICAAALPAYLQYRYLQFGGAALFAILTIVGSLIGGAAPLASFRFSAAWQKICAAASLLFGIFLLFFARAVTSSGGFATPHSADWYALALSAVLAGFLGNIADLSGLLGPPLLVLLAKTSTLQAQAVSLIALLIATALPLSVYAARGYLAGGSAVWLVVGSLLGSLVGSRFAVGLGIDAATPPDKSLLFYGATLLILGAIRLISRPYKAASRQAVGDTDDDAPESP